MDKPSKPSPDFPLFAHANGKWAKRIKGKLRYFGTWEDPQGARAEYQQWTHFSTSGASSQEAKPKRPNGVQIALCANSNRC